MRRSVLSPAAAMTALTSDRLDPWTRRTRLVGLAALVGWAIVPPVDIAWTAVLAAVLIASAAAAAVLGRHPEIHTLGGVMATAGARGTSGSETWARRRHVTRWPWRRRIEGGE